MWNITSFDGMKGFLALPNQFTSGWFWTMMLFGICAVVFIITKARMTADRAFATAGFASWIFGTFIFFLGWITWYIYAITIFLMIGGIIALIVRQDQEY